MYLKNTAPCLIILLIVSAILCQCRKKPDLEQEKHQLLLLHAAQQAAHLQENAAQFVAQFDDHMITVNRGKISSDGPEPTRRRIQQYFDAVEFKQWADLTPPLISFSDDGSMAYIVVDKSVVLTFENDQKLPVEESTHFAWVSIYKKQSDGTWKVVCNVSTNETPVERVLVQ